MNPKISLVIAARNDDYGGNFLNRIYTFTKILIYQTNKYKLPAELIVVEYNPPADKPSLDKVLVIQNNQYLNVRFITVPNKFHQKIAGESKNPFFEYIAKNIGIRRAKSEFVLSTNPDIIFSNEFIKFLTDDHLNESEFYRIDRCDLPALIFDKNMVVPDILDSCRKNVVRVMTNNGTLFFNTKRWLLRFMKKPTLGHFLRLPIFNFIVKFRAKFNPNQPHEAASGDFMMAHSNAWQTVKGFDQIPFNSFSDSYNLHMFLCHGFKQKILPLPIYHIGHKTSNDTRQQPDLKVYRNTILQMQKTKKPYKEYSDNWGYPEINFLEYKV